MLTVCTEEQKKLIETIASWNEKEDRNGNDKEAALLYLFLTNGCIFDPPDCPCIVKLTLRQLKNLEDALTYFLRRAENSGYGQPVKDALNIVEEQLAWHTSKTERWKNNFKRYLRLFGEFIIPFAWFWLFFSLKIAAFLAVSMAIFLECRKELFAEILEYINSQNTRNFSKILRRINYQEIKILRKWAKDHLYERGILKEPKPSKKTINDPEIALILKKLKDSLLDPDVSEAYDKCGL